MKSCDFKCKNCIFYKLKSSDEQKRESKAKKKEKKSADEINIKSKKKQKNYTCAANGKFEGNKACSKIIYNFKDVDLYNDKQRKLIAKIHNLSTTKLFNYKSKLDVNGIPLPLIAFQERHEVI